MKNSLNETEPLVSIIIPAFNASGTVKTAIYSILNQSYKNLELIIIDDGSYDDTLQKIRSISDSRIKIFSNKTNLGYLNSVNSAIDLCEGLYIGFQDADDTSQTNRIELQISELSKCPTATIALTQCFYKEAGKANSRTISNFPLTKAETISSLLAGETRIFCGASLLVERSNFSKIGKFRPLFDRIGAEHVDWFLRALRSEDFVTVDKPLYNYQIHPASFSRAATKDPLKFHSLQLALLSFIVFYESGFDPLSDDNLKLRVISSILESYSSGSGKMEFSTGLNHIRNGNFQASFQILLLLFSKGKVYMGLKFVLVVFSYFAIFKHLPESVSRFFIRKRNLLFVKKIRMLIEEKEQPKNQ